MNSNQQVMQEAVTSADSKNVQEIKHDPPAMKAKFSALLALQKKWNHKHGHKCLLDRP